MEAALPREYYVDSEHFVRELDMLRGQWTCVGRLDELGLTQAGRVAVVDFYGESIVVTNDGILHAHANVCRHRGSQILPADSPPCEMKALRCPYHSWTYALDGSLLHAPHTEDVNPADFALTSLAVDSWGGWLWLAEDPSGPLLGQLGEVPGRIKRYPLAKLVVGLRFTYDVQANWNVIAENYNECYHCGPVHPELCRLVPAFGGGGIDIPWENGVPHREGAWTFTMTGTTDRAPFPDLDEHERAKHKGELVYPNLMLSLSADHAASYRLVPLTANSARVVCELLFAPDEAAKPTFNPADAGDLWDLVNLQDWAICESVQRGMNSRYFRGGWYAPMENSSLDIRRWLLPRLGE